MVLGNLPPAEVLSGAIWSPGPASAPPALCAFVSPGLTPNGQRDHGAGEGCAQNWPGYYHAGGSTLLCSLEAAGRGLRLEERRRMWFEEGRRQARHGMMKMIAAY